MTTMKLPARLERLAFWRRARPQRRTPGNREIVLASLPVGLVATIAGIVSYSHIVALGLRTHQGSGDAHLLPFAVDFLIVAGSVILLAGYWLGWLCVAAGVAGTLFANLEFGLPYGWLSAVVSTWPAVAFTVATFVLERWLRSRRGDRGGTTAVTMPAVAHANGSGNGARPAGKPTNEELAAAAGVSVRTLQRRKNRETGSTP
jgi:AraC-like DNA-binding protein